MARKNIENFYTVIRQEGAAGAVRGKISGAMAAAMGAKDGSVIEWELQNGTVVGASILDKAETRAYMKEHSRTVPPKETAKPKKGKKSVAKETPEKRGTKKLKKATEVPSKSNKRKTKVSYEEPERKGKKKLKKPSLKHR